MKSCEYGSTVCLVEEDSSSISSNSGLPTLTYFCCRKLSEGRFFDLRVFYEINPVFFFSFFPQSFSGAFGKNAWSSTWTRTCLCCCWYLYYCCRFFLLLFFKIRIDAARTVGRTLLSSEVYYALHTACSSNRELPLVLETVQQGQILAKFILCSLIKVAYN